ncbi:hypothetical protein LINPERHAP1_LOCUS19370, partial [Linum perenne]
WDLGWHRKRELGDGFFVQSGRRGKRHKVQERKRWRLGVCWQRLRIRIRVGSIGRERENGIEQRRRLWKSGGDDGKVFQGRGNHRRQQWRLVGGRRGLSGKKGPVESGR